MSRTALTSKADLSAFETAIDASLTELRRLAIRGVEIIASLGRPFHEIHRRRLYQQRASNWDDYCLSRFGLTGTRCRQIADAYEVGLTLASSAGIDGTVDPTLMLEYLASVGFSEFLARALKSVPVDQQAIIFETARKVVGDDQPLLTAEVIEEIATETAELRVEWGAMTTEEQRESIVAAEQRQGATWDRQRCQAWVKMILKRNRAPLVDAGDLPLSEAEKSIAAKQRELVELCEQALGTEKAA